MPFENIKISAALGGVLRRYQTKGSNDECDASSSKPKAAMMSVMRHHQPNMPLGGVMRHHQPNMPLV
jgi:hypothetical protein